MNVLVTGGTGTLGRDVVTLLRQSGHRARIFARHTRGHVDAVQGDLATGDGIVRALAGMEVIVHAASATREPLRGRSVDVKGTRRLLELAREANIPHLVYISIVGIDESTYPYHRTKLLTEKVVREGLVPWSILRATQFHSFVEFLLAGFCRVPGLCALPFAWRLQPVQGREVARRLIDVALGAPSGMLPDFGGPEVRDLKSLAGPWLAARHERRRLVNLRLPFKFSRQFGQGKLSCPDHREGAVTFERYLVDRYAMR